MFQFLFRPEQRAETGTAYIVGGIHLSTQNICLKDLSISNKKKEVKQKIRRITLTLDNRRKPR